MQSLYPEQFDELMNQVRQIAPVVGRTVPAIGNIRRSSEALSAQPESRSARPPIQLEEKFFSSQLRFRSLAAGVVVFPRTRFPITVPHIASTPTSPTARAIPYGDRSAHFQPARTIPVGNEPTGVTANTKKNEIYIVNTGSSNVTVIDAERNRSRRGHRGAREAVFY